MPLDGKDWPRWESGDDHQRERVLVVLRDAKHRIRYPWRWAKYGSASYFFAGVCPWMLCAQEAVGRSCRGQREDYWPAIQTLNLTIPEGGPATVPEYNDDWLTTHGAVMRWFDRAIDVAESRLGDG